MKKKNIADNAENQKLHELEQAEIEKEKANRTKIHIQSRAVLVIVTGGLCLITVFLGIYMANKLAANKNGLNSSSNSYTEPQSSPASLNVSSSNSPVFTESGNNSDNVSSETNLQNPPVSNLNSNSNSNSVSGVGISSAGGVGNVPFPPSGQISGVVSNNTPTGEPNGSESSNDGNTHLPDVVDAPTSDTTTTDVSPQVTPSTGSGNNGNSQSQSEGRSPFDDMPFFNHGGGGMESTGTLDTSISETGITGEGFFH